MNALLFESLASCGFAKASNEIRIELFNCSRKQRGGINLNLRSSASIWETQSEAA
jgi:hypothetical protein